MGGEEYAFVRIGTPSPEGIVLACDHASNRLPADYGTLGVDAAVLARHVAWDIGAADLTRRLSALTGAQAILSSYSRLLIDCNRPPGHPTSIVAESHGVAVPGNADLSADEAAYREQAYFLPYHDAIAAAFGAFEAPGKAPALISIHSFTPFLDEYARPWHLGILSHRDRRLADHLLAALESQADLVVGDNQPYSGYCPEGYTCRRHGEEGGRANVLIEVRQDLIDNPGGVSMWAELLAPRIARAVADLPPRQG